MTAPMSIQERSHSALDLLDQAEREYAAGDNIQASAKFWGAATSAVVAIATERGWRCDSDRAIQDAVARLADEHDDALLQSEFSATQKFQINMHYDLMQDFELELDRPIVHDFVHHALALLKTPQPAQPGV